MNTWWKKKRKEVIKEAKTMDHEPKFKVGETVGYREESERIGCYKLGIIQDIRQREKESLKTACDLTYLTYDTVTEYYVVRNGFCGMPGVWFEACDLCKLSIKIEEENDMKKFTKDDLKVGMLVVNRGGKTFIIIENDNGDKYMTGENEYHNLDQYSDDLLLIPGEECTSDIMKVYGKAKCIYGLDNLLDVRTCTYGILSTIPNRDLLWERKEVKEMTVEEISKALGYEVKIVK